MTKFIEKIKAIIEWLKAHRYIAGVLTGFIISMAFVLTILFAVVINQR